MPLLLDDIRDLLTPREILSGLPGIDLSTPIHVYGEGCGRTVAKFATREAAEQALAVDTDDTATDPEWIETADVLSPAERELLLSLAPFAIDLDARAWVRAAG